ncbi:MAG: ferrous iron transport protein B [Spirochaetaceae bacterium]
MSVSGYTDRHTVAIVGNPNSGKTTIFNGLTGGRQRIGNYAGVTVELSEGRFTPKAFEQLLVAPFTTGANSGGVTTKTAELRDVHSIRVVDLPGIYSLSAGTADEAVARDFILSGEPDLVVDVVDAANMQRNLYLTVQLIEMGVPVVVVLNMMDAAEKLGISIDVDSLSEQLQCPVIPIVGTRSADIERLEHAIAEHAGQIPPSGVSVDYPEILEAAIADLEPQVAAVSQATGASARWVALALIDGDEWILDRVVETTEMSREAVQSHIDGIVQRLGDDIDVVLADSRYELIHELSRHVRRKHLSRETLTERLDRVILHRVLALPIFLGVMYAVFWFTMFVGGGFIDFFDIAFGTVFVDGFGAGLSAIGSPDWLTAILAGGIGSGIQTVATFIPILFAMFAALAVLEDSGYMARAAYVMDRLMRAMGLPGKSFVPMMVGFGCTVPAIMATRTLENRRDRFMTVFMSPFMSCGARLPVYALFAAALFGPRAGAIVFSLYIAGIVVAMATGFLLKYTLFRGRVSHFVMELPAYHVPRLRFIVVQARQRLWAFVRRAGVTITLIVAVLAVLNTFGEDGSVGRDDQRDSVLSGLGRAASPVFAPLGLEADNWEATVGLFTGIFAKEAVVGTLNSLYGQAETAEAGAPDFDFIGGMTDALRSIPDAFSGWGEALADPLGARIVSEDPEEVGSAFGTDATVFARLRNSFSPQAAYAYMLFVLLYFPCAAALAAAIREMGSGLGWLLAGYTTVVAWAVATLYYQLSTGPQFAETALAVGLLLATAVVLRILGATVFRPQVIEGMK